MSLRFYYRDDDGGITEAVNRVRIQDVELSHNAEEGTIAASELPFDDAIATYTISGHRKIYAVETEIDAGTDPHAGVVWVGYSAERGVERKDTRTGAERGWGIQAVDINTVWERRLLLGSDCDRPAETDVERMTWLAATTELELVDDTTYLSTEDPVDMEANDYRKQSPMSVLRDCMDQSGKNGYILNLKTTPDEYDDPNLFSLWYGHDSLEEYTSDARICNIISEVEGDEDTFYPVIRTVLTRDPSRTYSGVIVDYDGGYVYVSRDETATEFAPRDTTLSAPNVHSAAQAKARGRRFLTDVASEEDSIRTAIQVPAAKANIVMPGHRIQVRFTHLPGYADEYVWMRVATRTIRILTDGLYELELDLVAPAVPVPTLPLYGTLNGSGGPFSSGEGDNLVYWAHPGDTPGPGFPVVPTTGFISVLTDGSPPAGNRTYYGWLIDGGDGTVDVEFFATIAGVLTGSYTVTWAIRKNGTVVADESQALSGSLVYTGAEQLVSIAGLAVADGDEITATITCVPPTMPFFRTPSGAGQNTERLVITGGSLS